MGVVPLVLIVLALGAFLVVGFALHNTTEGLAVVAPVANEKPTLRRLTLLGLIAGAPAVLGAWIGAAAFNSSIAAFLFGFGAGAIVQVIVQLAPTLRDDEGRSLHPVAVGGMPAGLVLMFGTGLLVSVRGVPPGAEGSVAEEPVVALVGDGLDAPSA